MPSADDRCAAAGVRAVSKVITSPIAEMPGDAGLEALVDLDVAALERQAELLRRRGPAVTGPRPVATSRYSALIDCGLAVGAPGPRASTPSAPAFAAVTLVPVITLMPCFLNDRSSSADTASSSIGTSRGSSSMIVTSLPKRRKIEANSTPDGAAPHDRDRLRHLAQADGFVAGDDPLAIDLDAGHAARLRNRWRRDLLRGRRGSGPAPSVTSTLPLRRRAGRCP